jgi:cell division protein FtsB
VENAPGMLFRDSLRPARLLALAGIVLLGFLYWKPLHTYASTKHDLQARRADVSALRAQKAALERQIALSGTPGELTREARLLGLVKPGERLFIVKGISTWRKHNRR